MLLWKYQNGMSKWVQPKTIVVFNKILEELLKRRDNSRTRPYSFAELSEITGIRKTDMARYVTDLACHFLPFVRMIGARYCGKGFYVRNCVSLHKNYRVALKFLYDKQEGYYTRRKLRETKPSKKESEEVEE